MTTVSSMKRKARENPHYRRRIAVLAFVSERTVYRWSRGEVRIRPSLLERIDKAVREIERGEAAPLTGT